MSLDGHNESRADRAPQEGGMAAAISEGVSGQWNGILAAMTQQGFGRMDLVGLAVLTARSILTMTAQPMWPDPDDIPDEEGSVAASVEDISRRMGALLHALGVEDV